MSEARQITVLLEQAGVQRRLGNHRGAIELAQRALTLDPDHAEAHATLAFVLLDARRLPGALIEMKLALGLDAESLYVHSVAAAVLTAARKLDDAWAHCLIALDSPLPTPEARVLGARIQRLRGDPARAKELLQEALVLEPAHTDALSELARLELDAGDHAAARRMIEQALESDPSDHDAHVVAGHLALARGDTVDAEQHARFVLGQHAMDHDGLVLWTAIQARRSWVLGAWWRWHSWMSARDDHRQIALSIVSFVVVRLAVIISDELGYETVSRALSLAWLGFCAYTWIAPVQFRRMLARSLGDVQLDPEF